MPEQEIEHRIREAVELLEIGNLLSKKPQELSGGQRQRIAVGRALIRKPSVFLFDEPLSNLDALLREKVRHELKDLFRRLNATVVYVTHDQTEAMSLADRVVVLANGRVQQIGDPGELYRRPANRFVASFIGTPSMNLFRTNLEDGALQFGEDRYPTGVRMSGDVVVGIRPDAIRIINGKSAEVLWSENLGSHVLSGVRCGEVTVTALSASRPPGEAVSLRIDENDIYLFDALTGKNLDGRAADRSDRA
jgi:ABC-type sugar transport system ATPase subunit